MKKNNHYLPAYQLTTSLCQKDGQYFIVKRCSQPESKQHFMQLAEGSIFLQNTLSNLDICRCTREGDALCFPYLEGKSYLMQLLESINESKEAYLALWKNFATIIAPTKENSCLFQSTKEFEQLFGIHPEFDSATAYSCCCFDMTPSHIIKQNNGQFTLIDYEWCFRFPVPTELVLYHLVRITYANNASLKNIASFEEVLEMIGFTIKIDILENAHQNFLRAVTIDPNQQAQTTIALLKQQNAALTINYHQTTEELNLLRANFDNLNHALNEIVSTRDLYFSNWGVAHNELELAKQQIAHLENAYHTIVTSGAWKSTFPLRFAHKLMRKIKTCATYAVSLDWLPSRQPILTPQPLHKKNNRIAIYAFYDAQGQVDDYVPYFLNELQKVTQKILIVVNGELTEDGRKKLEPYASEIILRENVGFDAWGYKEAFAHLDAKTRLNCDELLLCNSSFFGPVGALQPVFDEMAARPLDFWGLTSRAELSVDPSGCCPYGYIPEHIEPYFIVFRKRLFLHDVFATFWNNLPEIHTHHESVGFYEAVLTHTFQDAGFTWDTFVDRKTSYELSNHPTVCIPKELIRDFHCPVFKRRAFLEDYNNLSQLTGTQTTTELYHYLKTETEYPVDFIWNHLLRICHLYSLSETMHLSRILSDQIADVDKMAPIVKNRGVALCMHIYNTSMIDELYHYAGSMPKNTDIYVSVTSDSTKQQVENRFADLAANTIVRLAPNRGRDVSSLLVTFRDIVPRYAYICVTHDKIDLHLKPLTVGQGFAYKCYENILATQEFVYNVIDAFENEPQLGLLVVSGPNHADFSTHLGLEWGDNYQTTKELAQRLHLNVPMDEAHIPCAPYGSSFWFRTDALKQLLDKEWTYEDFPAEPFSLTDGSLLHAIERIYPYVAQHSGYYTASLYSESYYSIEYGNLLHYTQNYSTMLWDEDIQGTFLDMRDILKFQLKVKKLEKSLTEYNE